MYINVFSYLVRNDTTKYGDSDDAKRKPTENRFFFSVHITDLIPIYAFRTIPLI